MLDQSVQYLKGVGPQRGKLFSRLGIATVRDLLSHFPRDYEDRRQINKIGALQSGQKATISGKVEASETLSLTMNLAVFKIAMSDGTGLAFAHFYRKINPYHRHDVFANLRQIFKTGDTVLVSGTVEFSFGEKQIKVDEYEPAALPPGENSIHFHRIVPLYSLTERVGQKWMREIMKAALERFSDQWPDILPHGLSTEKKCMHAPAALVEIHFPTDFSLAELARQRLAFDEFLLLETALTLARHSRQENIKPWRYQVKRDLLTPFRKKLAFEFTDAQKKAINEIFSDLQKPKPMNRLLLGDVGSGKTVVAASALLLAIENNYQTALLAPTEILAEQHYLTLRQMLSGLPVKVALLTGKYSRRGKRRQALVDEIAAGSVDLVIGTHALLEKGISFKRLSLIVIDEQHRFGVIQRATVRGKALSPDILLMTATPIPRTLALTLYGDMDISTIDALPPGRQPIETLHWDENTAYAFAQREIRKGRQVYIVYPLIEESDKFELKAAVKEAEKLSATVFSDFRVGLLHGQMTAEQKQNIMLEFRSGNLDLLIATTVIEVGIDVPNATVIIIEHADRFGLATLHQLRGRVGRGEAESYCILLGTPKTEEARKRIQVMLSTRNGFKIAEEDLCLRGPGEFLGTAQHGVPLLKAGNLVTDVRLIEEARHTARRIIAGDSCLVALPNALLKRELQREYRGRLGLLHVG